MPWDEIITWRVLYRDGTELFIEAMRHEALERAKQEGTGREVVSLIRKGSALDKLFRI